MQTTTVFEALSDPIRARICELLAERDLPAGDIAKRFTVTRPAVSRHLRILREAGLVSVRGEAQRRVYQLDPACLIELVRWTDALRKTWEARLDALGHHLDEMEKNEGKQTMTDQQLGQFLDRYTMVYERFYPHPPERVFEALTNADALDVWMMPVNHVEARLGGSFSFGFGDDEGLPGTIGEFVPGRVVDYFFGDANRSGMRFELEPADGGCKLKFIHSFDPSERFEEVADDPGGDLPGGPDTPWRPGFTAGFHLCLRNLGAYVNGESWLDLETSRAGVAANKAKNWDPEWVELCGVYRKHIKETIPARA